MRRILLILLAAARLASSVEAQVKRPSLYEKFQLDLSVTSLIINSNIRIDGNGGAGTDIDPEDDLGVSKLKIQPRGALRWRPGRRHELELSYQFARRSGERVIDIDIEVGDTVFERGTDVTTVFNTDQLSLTYRFAIIAKERTQFGLGLGLGALFVDVGLTSHETSANQEDRHAGGYTTAPIGSLGLYGRFLSGTRWYFEVDGRYINATIDRFTPQVVEWNAAARYALSERFELEAGYGGSGIELEIGPEDQSGIGEFGPGGRIKYGLQHFRLGVAWTP